MTPDPQRQFESDRKADRDIRSEVLHRSWESRLKETVETPGRFSAIVGGAAGLAIAVIYGLLIGGTDLKTVAVLSALLVFTFLLVVAGEFWWALLVLATSLGINTTEFGFRMTGFELGFIAVVAAYLVRTALRAMKRFRPDAGLGLPFFAIFIYLLFHAVLVIIYHRYEDPGSLKNMARGYFNVIAPMAFFYLLGKHCNPRTVRPVVSAFLLVTSSVIFVAIPVWLFKLEPAFLEELPFSISALSSIESEGVLRGSSILANFGIALWAVARTAPTRWLMQLMIGLSFVGAAASAGRLAVVCVLVVVILYLALNKKWGLCFVGMAGVVIMILISTYSPNLVERLPETAQRALSPLNMGDSQAKRNTELSDRWHRELREDSLEYWTESWSTFLFGHGFGAWDYSLSGDAAWSRDFDYAKKIAIQMGRTENVFSSITNIFGLFGLLFYTWFLVDVLKRLVRARKVVPNGSFEKAMCEVSLVYIIVILLLVPFAGGTPGWDLFYWQIGLLAARPFLGKQPNDKSSELRPPSDGWRENPSTGYRGERLPQIRPSFPPKPLTPVRRSKPF